MPVGLHVGAMHRDRCRPTELLHAATPVMTSVQAACLLPKVLEIEGSSSSALHSIDCLRYNDGRWANRNSRFE